MISVRSLTLKVMQRRSLSATDNVSAAPASSRSAAALDGQGRRLQGIGKTYVLVHGAFDGGWCWTGVARRLRALGHTVYTPTLTGLGERSHVMAARPTIDTFIEDVAQVLHFEDLTEVLLVGHSFAGSVISGVADRMPERLQHLVYLDAAVALPGQALTDIGPPGLVDGYRARARAAGGDGASIPPPAPEALCLATITFAGGDN